MAACMAGWFAVVLHVTLVLFELLISIDPFGGHMPFSRSDEVLRYTYLHSRSTGEVAHQLSWTSTAIMYGLKRR